MSNRDRDKYQSYLGAQKKKRKTQQKEEYLNKQQRSFQIPKYR